MTNVCLSFAGGTSLLVVSSLGWCSVPLGNAVVFTRLLWVGGTGPTFCRSARFTPCHQPRPALHCGFCWGLSWMLSLKDLVTGLRKVLGGTLLEGAASNQQVHGNCGPKVSPFPIDSYKPSASGSSPWMACPHLFSGATRCPPTACMLLPTTPSHSLASCAPYSSNIFSFSLLAWQFHEQPGQN